MRVKNIFELLAVLISVIVLSACSTLKGANMTHKAQLTIDDTHPRATLIIGSSDLVDNILITNVKIGKVGLLTRAAVDVQNLTDDRYQLEYKFVWRDRQGFPIDESNVWHRFVLTPRKIKSFQSVGKREDAYSVQFTVRFPDDLYIETDYQDEKAKPFF
ncbi:DUF1425 domain-containing protein [methane-oxidizing endosymbiont of Gigantopelta aegis]|uniref:DUF1425 domain-containing protein n=1 Tax=methane-oxidizing endosymbiont of Gigantopelta aegis TaxID=2794938 RepID=UPI0018DD397A|nr:DUF1425 domain-containing protein [methane-oxidizing endosymbiont of Gigantopelta aegis]